MYMHYMKETKKKKDIYLRIACTYIYDVCVIAIKASLHVRSNYKFWLLALLPPLYTLHIVFNIAAYKPGHVYYTIMINEYNLQIVTHAIIS